MLLRQISSLFHFGQSRLNLNELLFLLLIECAWAVSELKHVPRCWSSNPATTMDTFFFLMGIASYLSAISTMDNRTLVWIPQWLTDTRVVSVITDFLFNIQCFCCFWLVSGLRHDWERLEETLSILFLNETSYHTIKQHINRHRPSLARSIAYL